jgi:hypothetical protein
MDDKDTVETYARELDENYVETPCSPPILARQTYDLATKS